MQQNETVKLVIACVIAAIVLGCGLFVSSREPNEPNNAIPEDAISVTDESSADTQTIEPVQTAVAQTVHIDLFSGIRVASVGIYPNIEDMAIGCNPEDAVSRRVTYSFSSVGDFTPTGADVQIRADVSSIEDFLAENHYEPVSLTGSYRLDPMTTRSYLMRQKQFTKAVQDSCFAAAAETIGSPDALPESARLILPAFNMTFDPDNQDYAGKYGVCCFFSSGGKIKAVFVSPVIKDGKAESVSTADLGSFKDVSAAAAALMQQRSDDEISVVLLQTSENEKEEAND
ncbi:MAG: hypothetical protein IKQ91_01690 [Oscillospiraceae bacterium]|nr:hypothetical protein [Oscillospiraceae bacterium]MBR3448411.1 hypothetical protein [Oscillospiraceae bacterium]MBR4199974.1 hypothetical protein [Oscillospiraceae bacterium]